MVTYYELEPYLNALFVKSNQLNSSDAQTEKLDDQTQIYQQISNQDNFLLDLVQISASNAKGLAVKFIFIDVNFIQCMMSRCILCLCQPV